MKQPVHKVKAGAVSCALWHNEAKVDGRSVTILKATLDRRYRKGTGNWKSGGSFSRNEVPLAIWCLQRAFDYMLEKQPEEGQVEEEAVR